MRLNKTLTIVLDVDTVDSADGDLEEYLLGLLQLPEVQLLRYSDDGPPDGAVEDSKLGRFAKGWLVITPVDEPGYDLLATTTHSHDGDSIHQSAVRGGDLVTVPLHFILQQYNDPESHRDQVRRDLIMRMACGAAKATLLVTNRRTLTEPIPGLPNWKTEITAALPSEALPILGLWLRARGKYVVEAGRRIKGEVDRGGFYDIAAGELLPSSWRWARSIRHFPEDRATHASDFVATLHSRVGSALKARDRQKMAPLSMSAADARDESVDCVIETAWNLMGAFDAAAQLIELINSTSTPAKDVKWQHKDWVTKQEATLPEVLAVATQHRPIFNIVRALRNTVHGRLLHTVLVKGATGRGNDDQDYMSLPEEQTRALRAAFGALGGLERWGVRELVPGQLHADPGLLIDKMTLHATAAVSEILLKVPIEKLLDLTEELATETPDEPLIGRRQRSNVLQQLGLTLTQSTDASGHERAQ